MKNFKQWDKENPAVFDNANKLIGQVLGREEGWKAALEWVLGLGINSHVAEDEIIEELRDE